MGMVSEGAPHPPLALKANCWTENLAWAKGEDYLKKVFPFLQCNSQCSIKIIISVHVNKCKLALFAIWLCSADLDGGLILYGSVVNQLAPKQMVR